ncbi:HupE/UreJ family protein [Flavobacterium sp.]|uniref:HupE/UreJ family protein n=1 Tax=Flavobacterium sp. TaxID=239 RepID=UPI003750409B
MENITNYLQLGFTHVIPMGFDHILFILCLFFYSSKLKTVLLQCTIFTIAHSLALGLSASGIVIYNSKIIEPLIALTILYTAIENIFFTEKSKIRYLLIFIFGLIHGLGFATALKEIGIPKAQFYTSLLSFNIGVELGQITIILTAYFLISKWFSDKIWYKERIVYPISSAVGCVALYWVIERVLI